MLPVSTYTADKDSCLSHRVVPKVKMIQSWSEHVTQALESYDFNHAQDIFSSFVKNYDIKVTDHFECMKELFMTAFNAQHSGIVAYFLRHHNNFVSHIDKNGGMSLVSYAVNMHSSSILTLCLKYGMPGTALPSQSFIQPLHDAIRHNDFDCFRILIEYGVSLDVITEQDGTSFSTCSFMIKYASQEFITSLKKHYYHIYYTIFTSHTDVIPGVTGSSQVPIGMSAIVNENVDFFHEIITSKELCDKNFRSWQLIFETIITSQSYAILRYIIKEGMFYVLPSEDQALVKQHIEELNKQYKDGQLADPHALYILSFCYEYKLCGSLSQIEIIEQYKKTLDAYHAYVKVKSCSNTHLSYDYIPGNVCFAIARLYESYGARKGVNSTQYLNKSFIYYDKAGRYGYHPGYFRCYMILKGKGSSDRAQAYLTKASNTGNYAASFFKALQIRHSIDETSFVECFNAISCFKRCLRQFYARTYDDQLYEAQHMTLMNKIAREMMSCNGIYYGIGHLYGMLYQSSHFFTEGLASYTTIDISCYESFFYMLKDVETSGPSLASVFVGACYVCGISEFIPYNKDKRRTKLKDLIRMKNSSVPQAILNDAYIILGAIYSSDDPRMASFFDPNKAFSYYNRVAKQYKKQYIAASHPMIIKSYYERNRYKDAVLCDKEIVTRARYMHEYDPIQGALFYARIYLDGRIVPHNPHKALSILKKAVDTQGDESEKASLYAEYAITSHTYGSKNNKSAVLHYLKKAQKCGCSYAQKYIDNVKNKNQLSHFSHKKDTNKHIDNAHGDKHTSSQHSLSYLNKVLKHKIRKIYSKDSTHALRNINVSDSDVCMLHDSSIANMSHIDADIYHYTPNTLTTKHSIRHVYHKCDTDLLKDIAYDDGLSMQDYYHTGRVADIDDVLYHHNGYKDCIKKDLKQTLVCSDKREQDIPLRDSSARFFNDINGRSSFPLNDISYDTWDNPHEARYASKALARYFKAIHKDKEMLYGQGTLSFQGYHTSGLSIDIIDSSCMERALAHGGHDARYVYALLLWNECKYNESIEQYRVLCHASYTDAYIMYAHALRSYHNYDDALFWYHQAAKYDRNAYYYLYCTYSEYGDHMSALLYLHKGIEKESRLCVSHQSRLFTHPQFEGTPSHKKALSYINTLAECDYAPSLYDKARYEYSVSNHKKGHYYTLKSALHGYKPAQYQVALQYLNGYGCNHQKGLYTYWMDRYNS
jgi:TPR repeat protein